MKSITESIIGKKGMSSVWPNPYGLTEKDAKGKLKNIPLEIITLALYDAYLSGSHSDLGDLQKMGLEGAFIWEVSKEGYEFWRSIDIGNFDVFYKAYTPNELKKRLEE